MKRSLMRPITSYFSKKVKYQEINDGSTADATTTDTTVNKNCNAMTDISSDSPMLLNSATVTPPASSIAQLSQVGFVQLVQTLQ